MIERILGSKVKVKILRMMMTNITRQYTLQEIVTGLGLSFGAAHPAVKDLEDRRIILSTRVGRSNLYRVNTSHVLFESIEKMVEREHSAFKDIAAEFSEIVDKKSVKNIILFGSVARGDTLEPGDIDILMITRPGFSEQSEKEAASKIEEENDVHISPICITEEEAKQKIKKFDGFMLTVIEEGKVLYGDDRWLRQ